MKHHSKNLIKNDPPAAPRLSSLQTAVACAGAFVALVNCQFFLYRHYFEKFISPFFPVNFDQLTVYGFTYKAHYSILQEGLLKALQDPNLLRSGEFLKGCIVQILAVTFSFLFGPSRLGVGAVNFAFFAGAETVLFLAFAVRGQFIAAFFSLGLWMMCQTHYFHTGGMNDLRFDYGGMFSLGLAFAACLRYLQNGKQISLVWAAIALLFCVFTRSVLIAYATTALGIFAVGAFAISRFAKNADASSNSSASSALSASSARSASSSSETFHLSKRAATLCIAALACFALFVALFWKALAGYYVLGKTSGEDLMWMRVNNVNNILDRLSYYPQSFLLHFGSVLCAALPVFLVLRVRRTRDAAPENSQSPISSPTSAQSEQSNSEELVEDSRRAFIALAFFGCVAFSVYFWATSYEPTPVVIGVLAAPLCLTLSECFAWLSAVRNFKQLSVALSVLILSVGMYTYGQQMVKPTFIPHHNRDSSEAVNDVMSSVCKYVHERGSVPTRIFWCVDHDGLNELCLSIEYAERYHESLPATIKADIVHAFPATSKDDLLKSIKASDLVIVPTILPPLKRGEVQYEGSKSVRACLPDLLEAIHRDFKPVGETWFYQTPSSWAGKVGVFKHP